MLSKRPLPRFRSAPPKPSPTLLTGSSNQTLLAIISFLDLKSLENLQLTNRKMRQLFLSFFWNNLLVVTFHVSGPPLLNRSHHEIFRKRYFLKYPEELPNFHNMIRMKREEERRKLEEIERKQESMAEEVRKKKQELRENFSRVKEIQKWEIRILFAFLLLDFVGGFTKMMAYTYTYNCDSQLDRCRDLSRQMFFQSALVDVLVLIKAVYVMFNENFDSFGRNLKEITSQSWKTCLKLIFTLAAAFFEFLNYVNIMESPCNGYKSGVCQIRVNSGGMMYLGSVFGLVCIGLLHAYKLYLELSLSWKAPRRSQPLLGSGSFDYDDDYLY